MAGLLESQLARVVVCMRELDMFAEALAESSGQIGDVSGRLSMFGVVREACVPADIREDATKQLARAVHSTYVASQSARGDTSAVNSSMVPWEQLPESLRRANIAQAFDIGAKLDEIGAIVVPESVSPNAFAFTGQEIELLAQREHQRWVRERLADGWKFGGSRDGSKRTHPDLMSWERLDEASKDKDRAADEAIPRIPHNAGYQILRLSA